MKDQQISAFNPLIGVVGGIKRLERPWGFRLYPEPKSGSCINGLIHVYKGERAQLTIDSAMQRCWFIVNGKGFITWEGGQGDTVRSELKPGVGFTSQKGKDYKIEAVTDCDVVELIVRR